MNFRMRTFLWVLALAFTSNLSLWGQATGTISGTVRDSSNAVVPDATVTAKQVGTNFTREARSNSIGEYVVPLLPAGNYEVRVDKAGFTSFLQTGITLDANTQAQADAVLQPGGVASKVTVDATPSLLQTTSTTLTQVVDAQRIVDLPLNGRDVLSLVGLNAGVATTGVNVIYQGDNLSLGTLQPAVSIGGARSMASDYLLDNADFNDPQTNINYVYPNPDAVAEFSVQTSTFDAQYGRAAGGIINAVTKSGTNQFHGDAFEFVRNYDMNARNFFSSGPDTIKQNQFGGTVGGPIRKDKTFFFGSYQGTRTHNKVASNTATVPSAAMESGNFSAWLMPNGTGTIINPLTGTPFPNNIIPMTQEDPVAAKILALITPSNTYSIRFSTPESITDDNQAVARIDQSFGEKQHLWGRFYLFHLNTLGTISPNLLSDINGQAGTLYNIAVGYNYIFSPKWLNELSFSFGREVANRTTASTPLENLQLLGSNVLNPSGISLLDVSINGWSGITYGNYAHNHLHTYQVTDTFSYNNGRQNLRFGPDFRIYRPQFESYSSTGGTASFSGQLLSLPGEQDAGNAYAEFFLGRVNSFHQASKSHLDQLQLRYSMFVQDDVRLTQKLTVNLGLRWNPELGPSVGGNQWTTFSPGQQSTIFTNAPLGIVSYGDPGVGTVIPSKWNLWAPRIGLAYLVTPKTVVRTAYGVFFGEFPGIDLNNMVQNLPWVNSATLTNVQYSNPYGSGTPFNPLVFTPAANQQFSAYNSYIFPTHAQTPDYTQNWNLVVERQLTGTLLLRASYVGSKGTHELDSLDDNAAIYGPGATAANVNSRRTYANIGDMALLSSNANSTYNSLQVTVEKRYGHGFSVLANYTYSKSMDDTSYCYEGLADCGDPDPFSYKYNYGPSDFDVAHRLVISGIWGSPELKGQRAPIRDILGGWRMNGIFTTQTGNALTVLSGTDTAYDGDGGEWADTTGVPWRLPSGRSKHADLSEWFNISAFRTAQTGTFGDAGRNIIWGPGLWNLDYSLFKEFAIKEQMRVQIRGEFFNVFNHANLSNPGVTVNSSTFGVINGASSPRIVQIALKLFF